MAQTKDPFQSIPLAAEDYQRVVALPLKVCSDLAAGRGDPQMYNDLASMVALIALTDTLAQLSWTERSEVPINSPELAFDQAPWGACVMVLKEAGLVDQAVDDCLLALQTIIKKINAAGLLQPQFSTLQTAWEQIKKPDTEAATGFLKSAAIHIILAVDGYEFSHAPTHSNG